MKNTLAIAHKELRIYLTTWTAWVLLIAFLEITAFFFYVLVGEFQRSHLRYVEARAAGILDEMNLTDLVVGPLFSYVATFFIFMLPILTMRLIAEERRSRTMELMLTVPIRPVEIVLGKYIAAFAVMLMMLALTLIFPAMLHFFGDAGAGAAVDWRTIAAGYLGMLLLGAAALAVGMFASAVTESQVIAVVIGFAVLLVLLVIGMAAEGGGVWQGLASHLSISNHLHPFARGLVRSVDVIYYLSLTFVGLFLTYRFVEAERWR